MTITEVCFSIPLHACILIRVAGHLGVRLPASPPPLPRHDGGGQSWPCTCVQGPKKNVETSTCRCTGTSTGMPTSLSRKSGPVEHHEDELHLRHIHCDAHQVQGACHCTQRARKPRPRTGGIAPGASTSCNCGDSTVFSTSAPEEPADLAQPRRRTLCRWSATGQSLWSAE